MKNKKSESLLRQQSNLMPVSGTKRKSDVVASFAVVRTARRASVVASTAGASLTVAGAVVFLLDNNRVTIAVVSVNKQREQLIKGG